MPGRPEVFRGVLVLRVVAATDMAAGSAKTKVNPRVAGGEALFASRGIGTDGHYEVQVVALRAHDAVSIRARRVPWVSGHRACVTADTNGWTRVTA